MWDSGDLTVSFNGYSETVHYAEYSSPEALAAGLAAKFVRDYVQYGLYAKAGAPGTGLDVVTLQLTGGQQFGCLMATGPTTSFTLYPSGFASSCSGPVDFGTVTLTVNGSVVSTTHYGEGSTPITVADGLASMASSGAVTVKSVGSGQVSVTSQTAGGGTDYPYQVSVVDDTAGATPAVSATPAGGTLEGGSDASAGGAPSTVYSYGLTYDAASNVQTMRDSVMGSWAYGYDAFNRLVSGAAGSGAYVASQTPYLCWSYDSYGNRLHQTLSSTQFANGATCQAAGGATLQDTAVTYTASNRIASSTLPGVSGTVTPSYDAAGDVVNDGVNTTYLYDAEGRVCAVHGPYGMTGYQYDASGERVGKGTIASMNCDVTTNGYQPTNDYVLGQGGEQVTEVSIQNGVPAWEHTNVMADGMLVATYDTAGLHFYLNDALSSRRAQTNPAGQWEQNCLSLPYGDQLSCRMSISAPTEHHFTGKERDAESGLDYFGARYYASGMGRFMSPDWASKPEAVPYSTLGDPQSLNLYQYMRNNPLGGVDGDGHWPIFDATNPDHWRNLGSNLGSIGLGLAKGLVNVINMVQGDCSCQSRTVAPLAPSNGAEALGMFLSPLVVPGMSISVSAGAAPALETESVASTSLIQANAAQGAAWEDAVGASLRQGDPGTASQVTLQTQSGVRTVMDFVSKDANGSVALTEAKSSATARLTPNQAAAHPEIANTGATVVGQGKPGYPGGTQIPPTQVNVVRPQQ